MKKLIPSFLLLVVTFLMTFSCDALAEANLQGQWEINGDSRSGFPSMLILYNGGSASYDGLSGSWASDELELRIAIWGSISKFQYSFSGDVLVLTDNNGNQATFCKNGSQKGYIKPEIQEADVLYYLSQHTKYDPNMLIPTAHSESENSKVFSYNITENYPYGSIVKEIIVSATYNETRLLWDWSIEFDGINRDNGPSQTQLDILGHWVHKEKYHDDCYLDIYDIDLINLTISCSFSHHHGSYSDSGRGRYNLELKVDGSTISYYFTPIPIQYHDISFCISPQNGIYIPYYFDRYSFDRVLQYTPKAFNENEVLELYSNNGYEIIDSKNISTSETARIYQNTIKEIHNFVDIQIINKDVYSYSNAGKFWYLSETKVINVSENWHDIVGHWKRRTDLFSSYNDVFDISYFDGKKITIKGTYEWGFSSFTVDGSFDVKKATEVEHTSWNDDDPDWYIVELEHTRLRIDRDEGLINFDKK